MNTIGTAIQLTLFGASHAKTVGCILKGVPAGICVDMAAVRSDLDLRKPVSGIGTARDEPDEPVIDNLRNGMTTGDDIIITFENRDTRSCDYDRFRTVPRPGHADYPALVRGYDICGGGIFSGRMTAPLVAAGAVLRGFLMEYGILVGSCTVRIGCIADDSLYSPAEVMQGSRTNPLRAMNPAVEQLMREEILAAKKKGDSVGGIVRCVATGLPAGLGEPFFDTLDGEIAKAVFAVPGVKGVGFGAGFAVAGMSGSENNDAYRIQDGRVVTGTNHAGGVLGGMAAGAALDFTVAFKPPSSIAKPQESVNLCSLENTELRICGRHDPCIAFRGAIAVEAMTVFTIADLLVRGGYHA